MTVADADPEIAVDAVEMGQVELFERVAIPVLRALDEQTRVNGPLIAGNRGHALAHPLGRVPAEPGL